MMTLKEYNAIECPQTVCDETCPYWIECMVASHEFKACDDCPHRLTCQEQDTYFGCTTWIEYMGEEI